MQGALCKNCRSDFCEKYLFRKYLECARKHTLRILFTKVSKKKLNIMVYLKMRKIRVI